MQVQADAPGHIAPPAPGRLWRELAASLRNPEFWLLTSWLDILVRARRSYLGPVWLLMPSLVVSYSHSDADIARTVEGIAGALEVYRKALDEGVEKHLVGLPSKVVHRKYN